MANRTVSVELRLETAQYIAGVLESKDATEKLDGKVEDLDRDINKIPADSAKAAAGLGILGGTAKEVGTEVDDLGKKTEETAKKTDDAGQSAKTMRARMDELKDSLKATGAEMARNSDPELFKKFKSDSSELKGLESMVGKMEKLGVNVEQLGLKAKESEGFLSKIFAGSEEGFGTPEGMVLGAGAAVPALAAAGGLATGAIGAAGAGLGVAGAVMGDPQAFQAAWGTATDTVRKDLIDAGSAFVGPTMKAIESIGPTVDSWHLDKALAPAARFVPEITKGLEGAATGLEHGLADVIANAGPAVSELSADLSTLGTAAGDALSHIGDGAQGGAQALHDLVTVTALATEGFGYLTEGAEKTYGFIHDHPVLAAIGTGGLSIGASVWSNLFGDAGAGADKAKASVDQATTAVDDFGNVGGHAFQTINEKAADAAKMVERMEKDFDDATNKALGLRDAQVGAAQGLADLTKGWKSGTDALDVNSQKGRDNITLVDQLIAKYAKERDAAVAAGGGTQEAYDKANAAYKKQIDNLDALLTKLLGSKKAADAFMDAFKDKTITVKVNVVQTGSVSSEGVVSGGLPHRSNTPIAMAHGGIRRAADGLVVPPSDPGSVLFGEPSTKGEVFMPLAGIDTGRAMSLAQVAGDAYGFDVTSRTRGMMAANPGNWGGRSGGAIAVTLQMAPGANLTPLGSLFNGMLRDGLIVVKASQVRQNV